MKPALKDVVERISQGYVEWQENSFPGLLGNVIAGPNCHIVLIWAGRIVWLMRPVPAR
jgi:hypothetical protein